MSAAASAAGAPVLALRDAEVRRGRASVRVDELVLRAGERTVLLGPNGAGKSTLLLAMGGLLPLARGALLLGGRPAEELALRRAVTTVLQSPYLLDFSVQENVELPLRWRGVAAAERRARATRWLEALGVGALAGRRATTLSGGESQRVSLARAFATEPRALLLDEPFAAIDPRTRPALRADLARALAATGAAALIVTHDRDEAIALGDRTAVLLDGAVRQEGPTADVFRSPRDLAVAALVGVENVWAARVAALEGDTSVLDAAGVEVRALGGAPAPAVGATVQACLRPDDVLLFTGAAGARPDAGSARNRVALRVEAVTPSDRHVRVTLSRGAFVLVAFVSRAASEELGLAAGVEAVAVFKAASVHLVR